MKNTLLILLILLGLIGYSQSINVTLDATQILQNSDAGSVAYADIDLDGDNDLIITGAIATTTVYKNDGMGNFTVVSQPDIINVYAGASKFADVDNDGDMDLFMTGNNNTITATANLYFNDGTGIFTIASGTPFEGSNAGDIDFGDIDGDNDVDLIITGLDASNSAFAKLYLNDGSGSFTLVNGTSFTAVWKSATEFIDIDNDNDLDLLICGEGIAGLATTNLYKNIGSGSFSLDTGVSFEGVEFGDIAFGDTDNDGDQDILLTGEDNNGQPITKMYINNGASFSILPNIPFPETSFHSSTFADFNNDGNIDLLHIGNTASGLVGHIYENQGSNNFILADASLSGSYNGSNIVADLNGDGKLDIVTTGTSFTTPVRAPKIYINQSVSLSVNDFNSEDLYLVIFPNPSNDVINISSDEDQLLELEAYSLKGDLIFKTDLNSNTYNLNIVNYPTGTYILRIVNENGDVITKKIIKK